MRGGEVGEIGEEKYMRAVLMLSVENVSKRDVLKCSFRVPQVQNIYHKYEKVKCH